MRNFIKLLVKNAFLEDSVHFLNTFVQIKLQDWNPGILGLCEIRDYNPCIEK